MRRDKGGINSEMNSVKFIKKDSNPYSLWKTEKLVGRAADWITTDRTGGYAVDTAIGTGSDSYIANEIKRLIEKEHMLRTKGDDRMANDLYKGKPIVDFSPGTRQAYAKVDNNIFTFRDIRNFSITNRFGEGEITIGFGDLQVQKLGPYVKPEIVEFFPYNKRQSNKTASPKPKKVIFSGPATTILWKDGTKTTVKCQGDDVFDKETGIALCYLKKMLGNKGNYNNIFREAMKLSEVR